MDLTGQIFVLPVMLSVLVKIQSYLIDKFKVPVVQLFIESLRIAEL